MGFVMQQFAKRQTILNVQNFFVFSVLLVKIDLDNPINGKKTNLDEVCRRPEIDEF
jgi:hypothetical protein